MDIECRRCRSSRFTSVSRWLRIAGRWKDIEEHYSVPEQNMTIFDIRLTLSVPVGSFLITPDRWGLTFPIFNLRSALERQRVPHFKHIFSGNVNPHLYGVCRKYPTGTERVNRKSKLYAVNYSGSTSTSNDCFWMHRMAPRRLWIFRFLLFSYIAAHEI